jgi:hypothetical protein
MHLSFYSHTREISAIKNVVGGIIVCVKSLITVGDYEQNSILDSMYDEMKEFSLRMIKSEFYVR